MEKIKFISYLIFFILAVFTSLYRLQVFIFGYFGKTPVTDTTGNFLMKDVPEFFSLLFCIYVAYKAFILIVKSGRKMSGEKQ